MSTRDELANLIDDAIGWAGEEDIALAEHITDAILAAGYIKADREEWSVQGESDVPGDYWTEDPCGIGDRADAEIYRENEYSNDPRTWLVRSLVGPWEVA